MQPKRILIADDHFAIRTGVKHILMSKFPSIEYGEATDASETFQKLKEGKWDLLILDISLPDKNGLEVLRLLKEEMTTVPVLVFSMYREEQIAVRAFKAGASGYLSKESADTELVQAIQQILAGKKYVSPSVTQLLVSQLGVETHEAPHNLLSDREYQTLLLIASGKTVSQIAAVLSLSVATVSTYRARILEKMSLKNNAEITHYVIQNKLT